MSISTQCPQCLTRFRITPEQLDAHNGLVRCGHCQTVFNAREQLQNDAQTELPLIPHQDDWLTPMPPAAPPAAPPAPSSPPPTPEPDSPPAIQLDILDTLHDELIETPKKKRHWLWMGGSLLLLLVLLAQIGYFYRVALATEYPSLRPALLAECSMLHCVIPLPLNIDESSSNRVSIDSSNLGADPTHANFVSLEALLRNHASYTQAWPNLELTLIDTQGKPLARRIFQPTDYLPSGTPEKDGLAAGQEISIKLDLDIAGLNADGYKLLLLYP